jgi:putative hydrolase of the HAD superfamily
MTEALGVPSALLLDYGGTIVREERVNRGAGIARMLELASANPRGVDAATLQQATAHIKTQLVELLSPLIEYHGQALYRLAFDSLGVQFELSPGTLELEYFKTAVATRAQPGIRQTLEAARARSLPVGVVSNIAWSAQVLHHDLRRLGLDGYVEFVMASADYGVRKPHPALFRAAAGRLGAPPSQIWFVGDSLECDVAGARGVGMGAVWYNPLGREGGAIEPHAAVADWPAFVRLLESRLEDRPGG